MLLCLELGNLQIMETAFDFRMKQKYLEHMNIWRIV